MKNLEIIGENYPKVGEIFYWVDENNDIHEDTCLRIDEKDNPDINTMYFIYVSANGGGTFVTEDDVIEPWKMEVVKFKQKKAKEKAQNIAKYISQEEVRCELYNKLRENYFSEDDAEHILNILAEYE